MENCQVHFFFHGFIYLLVYIHGDIRKSLLGKPRKTLQG